MFVTDTGFYYMHDVRVGTFLPTNLIGRYRNQKQNIHQLKHLATPDIK